VNERPESIKSTISTPPYQPKNFFKVVRGGVEIDDNKIERRPAIQTRHTYRMELFYKNGTPTDIIYYGKHTRFSKKRCDKNKYAYVAEFDNKQFIHDGSHVIAEFDSYSDSPTIWTCNEKKENNKLNGPGTAVPNASKTIS
jgi:hypothetical protein